MSTLGRLIPPLPWDDIDGSLSERPSEDEIRNAVLHYKNKGLCGRRIAEDHLGPYFIASEQYGDRELTILEKIVAEEFANTPFCIRTRSDECSRLRGGCQNTGR